MSDESAITEVKTPSAFELLRVSHPVHFYNGHQGPLAAFIAAIHPVKNVTYTPGPSPVPIVVPFPNLVNLFVISDQGLPLNKIKVPFIADGEAVPASGNYCKAVS